MGRRTRRALLNILLLLGVITLLVYLNSRPARERRFNWSTIRHKSSSTTEFPEAHGVCPGLERSKKPALVVARVESDGDTEWLEQLSKKYHLCVYNVDQASASPSETKAKFKERTKTKTKEYLQVPQNRGHEAMTYLTFLISNHAHIPAAGAVFIHGSRFAWHNDHPLYDNMALLSSLNIPAAVEDFGYHNLRCDWSASMCAREYAPPQGSWENRVNAVLEPWNERAVSDAALPGAFSALFGEGEGKEEALGKTEAVRAQCCAQFVVARESILRHGKEEYEALRQWLLDGSETTERGQRVWHKDAAPRDDKVAGRILSYVWHVLFMDYDEGRREGVELDRLNRMACPSTQECYCRLYGRCGLEGCEAPGHCQGQYQLPQGFRLPKDWVENHS
ncbi:hypothetical protein K402DRAFT_397434 [Aulographum hederae CBS 113979]|uniref:Uncharacterized protein n=1 Tax=Aulographum hederae CBS 113979 TaxID=1176131 RepID=A0A6G1GP38_9PEZI|nr:hypothetical protein K402DRAFT_397434 [Aulographum hederae CBS 113979]